MGDQAKGKAKAKAAPRPHEVQHRLAAHTADPNCMMWTVEGSCVNCVFCLVIPTFVYMQEQPKY